MGSMQIRSNEDPVSQSSFNERAEQLLPRIEYRLLVSPTDRLQAFQMRYEAYLREGTVEANDSQSFSDADDDLGNSYIFGVFLDGTLASSIRVHVAVAPDDCLPSARVFPDVLLPPLRSGRRIQDPTRFVLSEAVAGKIPEMPLLTLRTVWLLGEHFEVDMSLAAVRAEHRAFYMRTCGHKPVSDARPYPMLNKPIVCLSADFQTMKERNYQRFPFLRSTPQERAELLRPVRAAAHPAYRGSGTMSFLTAGAVSDALR